MVDVFLNSATGEVLTTADGTPLIADYWTGIEVVHTLEDMASSISGVVIVAAEAAITLDDLGSTISGSPGRRASVVHAMPDLGSTIYANASTEGITAIAIIPLQDIAATVETRVVVSAQASIQLDPVFSTITVDPIIHIEAAQTLEDFTSSIEGTLPVVGTSDVTLEGVSQTFGLRVRVLAGTTATLEDATLVSSGRVASALRLEVQLEDFTSQFEAQVRVAGYAEIALENLTAGSSGTVKVVGVTEVTFEDIVSSIEGLVKPPPELNGTIIHTLEDLTSVIRGGIAVGAYSSVTLQNFVNPLFSAVVIAGEIDTQLPSDVRVLPTLINWGNKLTITTSFKTDIFQSRSGREQRRALRVMPRRSFEFTDLAYGSRLQSLNNSILGWAQHRFLIPDSVRGFRTTTEIAPHQTNFSVDGSPDWMGQGAPIVLSYGNRQSVRNLLIVDGGYVILANSDGETWPVGTFVCPGVYGRLTTNNAISLHTSRVGEATIQFDVDPLSEVLPEYAIELPLHRQTEVFLQKPNWARNLDSQIMANMEVLDFGRGGIAVYDPTKFRQHQLRATYTARNLTESRAAEQFFRRARGRRGSFFMPTWQDDMTLRDPFAASALSIVVEGFYINELFQNDKSHRDICLRTYDGRTIIRTIDYVLPEGLDSEIAFTEALPNDVTSDDVMSISWFLRWRLGNDALSVVYETDLVTQYEMTFLSLEADPEDLEEAA